MESSLKLQIDVKNNAQDLQNYVLELNNWEEEMKRKETELNKEKYQESSIPPPRNKIKRSKTENEKNSNKPKKISAYDYSAWDKFDVEKACADIDREDETEKVEQEEVVEEAVKDESNDEEDEGDNDLKCSKRLSLIDEAYYEKEMGNNFVKKGQWTDAIKCYTVAIDLDSNNAIYYANRSLCFLKLKNFKSAETDATTAIQLDKNYVKAYQRRAFARQALGQLQEAKSDYEQILKLEPKNALARVECSKIEDKLKKDQEKIKSVTTKVFEPKNMFKDEDKLKVDSAKPVKTQTQPSKTVDPSKKQPQTSVDSSKKETPASKFPKVNINDEKSESKQNLSSNKIVRTLEKGDGDKVSPTQSTTAKSGVFKVLPEWCRVISPVNLPPHKRSKKPLKKINISFIREEDNFAVEEKIECSNMNGEKDDKIVANKSDTKWTLMSLSKPVEDEGFKNERLCFEIPKTAIQFQKCWKILRKNPEEAYSYLKKIPGNELAQIFENSLESDFFSELITFLASDEIKKEPDIIHNFLLGLSKVKRFSSLILFMSEADRGCLKKIVTELGNVRSKEEMSELCRLYELNV